MGKDVSACLMVCWCCVDKGTPLPLGGFNDDLVWHNRMSEEPAQKWFRQLALECAKDVAASGLS